MPDPDRLQLQAVPRRAAQGAIHAADKADEPATTHQGRELRLFIRPPYGVRLPARFAAPGTLRQRQEEVRRVTRIPYALQSLWTQQRRIADHLTLVEEGCRDGDTLEMSGWLRGGGPTQEESGSGGSTEDTENQEHGAGSGIGGGCPGVGTTPTAEVTDGGDESGELDALVGAIDAEWDATLACDEALQRALEDATLLAAETADASDPPRLREAPIEDDVARRPQPPAGTLPAPYAGAAPDGSIPCRGRHGR